jgi:hypothetical protein
MLEPGRRLALAAAIPQTLPRADRPGGSPHKAMSFLELLAPSVKN